MEIHTCLPWPKNDNTILEAKTIQSGIISEVDRLQKREGNLFVKSFCTYFVFFSSQIYTVLDLSRIFFVSFQFQEFGFRVGFEKIIHSITTQKSHKIFKFYYIAKKY